MWYASVSKAFGYGGHIIADINVVVLPSIRRNRILIDRGMWPIDSRG